MTNQRAEITAAIEACRLCFRMLITPDFPQMIRHVVIKSDSAYLVDSMVTHVEKWRLSNYTSSRGRPVVNGDMLRNLDAWLVWLEEEKGVDVRFWHVSRAQNKQADKLANAALDGVDYKQFTRDDLFD
jgi:ribonuclease HI